MPSPVHCCVAAFLAGAIAVGQPPPNVESRVEALLARMTLDEKIGQMSQSTAMATPISDGIKAEIRAGRWGSFLNAGSPADRAEAQRIATTESRLGIPLLFGRDVIHGYKTIFPIPLGAGRHVGSGTWWSRRPARRRSEAAAEGIRWTFAPMIDIARDPRWGRIAESLGEDPRLAAHAGRRHGARLSGQPLWTMPHRVAACAKHFAGYGAAEAGRDYNSAWIPEILLREVYLPPFRAARDAGVATFMTSFNTLERRARHGKSLPAAPDSARRVEIRRHGGERLRSRHGDDPPRLRRRRARGRAKGRAARASTWKWSAPPTSTT